MHLHRPAYLVALACTVLVGAGQAHAQRGGGFVMHEQVPDPAPDAHVPGLLDTNQPARGDLVIGLPLMTVDYGVTHNLSVGTSAIFPIAAAAAGGPGMSAKLRYRFFARGRIVSTFTAYAGGLALSTDGEEDAAGDSEPMSGTLWGVVVVSSTSFVAHPRHRFTASAIGLRLGGRQEVVEEGVRTHAREGVLGAAVAGSYQASVAPWFGVHTSLISFPLLRGELDTDVASASVDADEMSLRKRVFLRVIGNLRAGTWLFSVGGVFRMKTAPPIPWIGIAKRW